MPGYICLIFQAHGIKINTAVKSFFFFFKQAALSLASLVSSSLYFAASRGGGSESEKCYLLSRVQIFVIPWIEARQAPLSMGFSWQEYWSGLPFFRGIFPTQELNLGLLYCRQILYLLSHQGSPFWQESRGIPDSLGCGVTPPLRAPSIHHYSPRSWPCCPCSTDHSGSQLRRTGLW